MRVNVIDLICIQLGIAQCIDHATPGAVTALRRLGHVIGIGAHAEPNQLSIDCGPAALGILVLFQHHDARTVAHDETVAVLIKRSAGGLGIVIARRQRPRSGKAAQTAGRSRHLGATGYHDISIAVFDYAPRFTDAVGSRGTGGNKGEIGAFHPIHDGQVARNHVDDIAGDKEW